MTNDLPRETLAAWQPLNGPRTTMLDALHTEAHWLNAEINTTYDTVASITTIPVSRQALADRIIWLNAHPDAGINDYLAANPDHRAVFAVEHALRAL